MFTKESDPRRRTESEYGKLLALLFKSLLIGCLPGQFCLISQISSMAELQSVAGLEVDSLLIYITMQPQPVGLSWGLPPSQAAKRVDNLTATSDLRYL